jgi:hypothetical protein
MPLAWLAAGNAVSRIVRDRSKSYLQDSNSGSFATFVAIRRAPNQRHGRALGRNERRPIESKLPPIQCFLIPSPGIPACGIGEGIKENMSFFDGPGFHLQNGQPLQSFTKDTFIQYQQEIDEKTKQLKAEQDRIEAKQKGKQEAENRRQLELQKKAEEEQRRRAAEAQRLSEAAKQCDNLAANPNDTNKVGVGVAYGDLKPHAADTKHRRGKRNCLRREPYGWQRRMPRQSQYPRPR